jgi:hypothetical protein
MDLASEPEWQDEDNHKVAGAPGGSRDE